jgi:hypothetical protein
VRAREIAHRRVFAVDGRGRAQVRIHDHTLSERRPRRGHPGDAVVRALVLNPEA